MVLGGLKLQQQQQIRIAALTQRDAPDHVAVSAFPSGGVEFRVDPLHRIEVQIGDPGQGNEFAQKLRNHAWIAEPAMIEGVVVRHSRSMRGDRLINR